MHLYFFIRGINEKAETLKVLLQGQFFKWKRKNLKTGKEEFILVQGSLRPTLWGAYEYVFPEEALAEVLSMMNSHARDFSIWKDKRQIKVMLMRPFFNCRKIPKKVLNKIDKIPQNIMLENSERGLAACAVDGAGFIIIGIKKDKRGEWKEIGYEQEML